MKLTRKFKKLDTEILLKTFDVSLGDKQVETPVKSGFSGGPHTGINEIYRELTIEKLKGLLRDESAERSVNRQLKNKQTTAINFCFVNCPDPQRIGEKELEALSDIQYENSDVSITPLLSGIIEKLKEDPLLDEFTKTTNAFISHVKTLNNKTIVGVVPSKMPRQFMEKIVDNYHNQDITSFVVDFGGRSVDSNPSWTRAFMRRLKNLGIMEEALLYSINSCRGKFMRNATSVLAKDFVAVGYGFDVIGGNHVRQRMPSEVWNKIRQMKGTAETFRVFNPSAYSYDKWTKRELASLGLDGMANVTQHNTGEQHKETLILKKTLDESETVLPYLRTKPRIDDKVVKAIKKVREGTFKK